MRQRFSRAFSWYSIHINKILLYTAGISLLILFLERLAVIFSYEAHTAGIDNNFDYAIIRYLAGYSLYPNPSAYPFSVNPYAPLFFIISKNFASLLHITASDTIAVFRVSRTVALFADTGTCIFLFFIVKRVIKASRPVTILAICLFFAILGYLGYTINRSDAPFLFFYCSTLYFLLHNNIRKSIIRSLIIAALVTFCIYSKQNGIILLLLVPVWFYLEKDYRSIIQFLFFSVIFSSGLFIYFEYYYTNHFFSEHVINSLKNKIDPAWFYKYVFKLMANSYLTMPLAVAIIISIRSIARKTDLRLRRMSIFFLLQFLFSSALCFKWGSSQGYYNECFLLSFIIIPAFYNGNAATVLPEFIKTAGTYAYPAFIIFMLNITGQLYFFFINSNAKLKARYTEQIVIGNYIKKEIGGKNRYVIDYSNADVNFFKNILYKECAVPNIDAVGCCTLPDKIFDYSGLLTGIKTGEIAFIIQNKGCPADQLWGADIRHYKPDTSFNSYTVYKYDSASLNP